MKKREPILRRTEEIEAVPCPCGESRRLITRADSRNLGLHVTHICAGETHYHERTEEIYYVLEGEGFIELDGKAHEIRPGTAIYIPIGVRHRGRGDFAAVIVTHPAFDPEDEIVVPQ